MMDTLLLVIYAVVRVRGIKTAVMYFPNEVSLLSPLVHLLKQYDEADSSNWKSQYVLLYWIQLLLLSPFDISTIQEEHEDLTAEIYSLSMLYLPRTDMTGEVASTLLAHLLSRSFLFLVFPIDMTSPRSTSTLPSNSSNRICKPPRPWLATPPLPSSPSSNSYRWRISSQSLVRSSQAPDAQRTSLNRCFHAARKSCRRRQAARSCEFSP